MSHDQFIYLLLIAFAIFTLIGLLNSSYTKPPSCG